MRADPRATDREGQEIEYRRQAVANIRKALARRASPEERWLFWRDQMLLDRALDPIRDTPEIQALDEELRQAVQGRNR